MSETTSAPIDTVQTLYAQQYRIEQLTNELLRLKLDIAESTSNSNSSLPKNLRLPNFESYSGHKYEDLEAWIFQIEEYFSLLKIQDEELRIQIAGTALRKDARIWYRSARISEGDKIRSWEEFKIQIKNQFCPINPIKLARDKISELRQTTSVRDYTCQFRQLCTIISSMSEDEKLDRYIRGLKLRTRKEVEIREPSTFLEAVRIAEKMDICLDRVYQPSSRLFQQTRFYHQNGTTPMEINTLQKKGPISKEEKERRMKNNLCMYCGSSNHMRDKCPIAPKANRFHWQGNENWRSGIRQDPRNAKTQFQDKNH